MTALSLHQVSVSVNSHLILKEVTLDIKSGEFLGIIGPNGAGKTTLFRAAAGLIPVAKGEVILGENPLARLGRREIARGIGIVPQLSLPLPGFTAREMVAMGRHPHLTRFSQEGERDLSAVNEAMARARVNDFAGRPVATLSGGEFQRVLIARALAQEPEVLLLDEPTSHLDIRYQREIMELLLAIKEKIAVVATFHDLNLASRTDRLALLAEGQVVALGKPPEVLTADNIRRVYGVDTW